MSRRQQRTQQAAPGRHRGSSDVPPAGRRPTSVSRPTCASSRSRRCAHRRIDLVAAGARTCSTMRASLAAKPSSGKLIDIDAGRREAIQQRQRRGGVDVGERRAVDRQPGRELTARPARARSRAGVPRRQAPPSTRTSRSCARCSCADGAMDACAGPAGIVRRLFGDGARSGHASGAGLVQRQAITAPRHERAAAGSLSRGTQAMQQHQREQRRAAAAAAPSTSQSPRRRVSRSAGLRRCWVRRGSMVSRFSQAIASCSRSATGGPPRDGSAPAGTRPAGTGVTWASGARLSTARRDAQAASSCLRTYGRMPPCL